MNILDKLSSKLSPWRSSLSDVFELFLECFAEKLRCLRFLRFTFPFDKVGMDSGRLIGVDIAAAASEVGVVKPLSSSMQSVNYS